MGSTNRIQLILLALISAAGAALRINRIDAASLWLDEGFTVKFSRLPWPEVLGFQGAYDPHPPLYYAVVKAVAIAVPDLHAGRVLSVIAGTLTVPVVYALAVQLAGRWPAVVASFALAISPIHIWYSQEARQYALVTLLVALSYLSLVLYVGHARGLRAACHAITALLALYVDYSAVFALIPQALIIGYVLWRYRRAAVALVYGGLAVVAGYLPWLPQLIESAEREGSSRAGYLGVSQERLTSAIFSLLGFRGEGVYFWGGPTPWERWPDLKPVIAVLVLLVTVLGVFALTRRSVIAGLVVLSLAGTVPVAIGLSSVSPAFAERTVLPATIAWFLILGMIPFGLPSSIFRAVGAVVVGAALVLSLVTVRAVQDGDKQHWRALANDAGVAAQLSGPVITSPTITETLIDVYQPDALASPHISVDDQGSLPEPLPESITAASAVWHAYLETPASERVHQRLVNSGYQRLMHKHHRENLYVDLYARPGSVRGEAMPVNGNFRGNTERVEGWSLPEQGVELDAGEARAVTIIRQSPGESSLVRTVPASPETIYTLRADVRARLQSGSVRAFLVCLSESGDWLHVYPDGSGASVTSGGGWRRIEFAALCPEQTGRLIIDLRNSGVGRVSVQNLSLHAWRPGSSGN